jgi:hypothetical protein
MKLQRKEAGLIYGNEYGMEKDNDNGRMKEGRKTGIGKYWHRIETTGGKSLKRPRFTTDCRATKEEEENIFVTSCLFYRTIFYIVLFIFATKFLVSCLLH